MVRLPELSNSFFVIQRQQRAWAERRNITFDSRERVAAMLQSLGREEALAAATQNAPGNLAAEPIAEVSCAFCGQTYRLSRGEVLALFEQRSEAPGSDTLQ